MKLEFLGFAMICLIKQMHCKGPVFHRRHMIPSKQKSKITVVVLFLIIFRLGLFTGQSSLSFMLLFTSSCHACLPLSPLSAFASLGYPDFSNFAFMLPKFRHLQVMQKIVDVYFNLKCVTPVVPVWLQKQPVVSELQLRCPILWWSSN